MKWAANEFSIDDIGLKGHMIAGSGHPVQFYPGIYAARYQLRARALVNRPRIIPQALPLLRVCLRIRRRTSANAICRETDLPRERNIENGKTISRRRGYDRATVRCRFRRQFRAAERVSLPELASADRALITRFPFTAIFLSKDRCRMRVAPSGNHPAPYYLTEPINMRCYQTGW